MNCLTPQISICVAIFNAESYLAECVSSILSQTYTNIEVILVDDGSTDSSLAICRSFLDQRIQIVRQDNRGLSSARQAGFNASAGSYVCFIDADDILDSRYAECLAAAITDRYDIAVCGYRDFRDGYERVYGFTGNAGRMAGCPTAEGLAGHFSEIASFYYMSDSWNKIYRADFLRKCGVNFQLDRRYNGTDLQFNHRLLLHRPRLCAVNRTLYSHRLVEGSRVRRKKKPLLEAFHAIVDSLAEEAKDLGYGDRMNLQLSAVYANLLRYAAQDIVDEESDCRALSSRLSALRRSHLAYMESRSWVMFGHYPGASASLRAFLLSLEAFGGKTLPIYLRVRNRVTVRNMR